MLIFLAAEEKSVWKLRGLSHMGWHRDIDLVRCHDGWWIQKDGCHLSFVLLNQEAFCHPFQIYHFIITLEQWRLYTHQRGGNYSAFTVETISLASLGVHHRKTSESHNWDGCDCQLLGAAIVFPLRKFLINPPALFPISDEKILWINLRKCR